MANARNPLSPARFPKGHSDWAERFLGRPEMRLAVVSPFLDRQHGTEHCLIEQLERFINTYHWTVELYSQRVGWIDDLNCCEDQAKMPRDFLRWHRVSEIPGPHLVKYLWWLFANQLRRWQDRQLNRVCPDLVYSPGINCFDADVVVVHIIFHALYERVRAQLTLHGIPLQNWPRVIHRKLYYRLAMLLERKIYQDPRVHLIAVSSLVARRLKTIFGRNDVVVIPNGVDTTRFNPEVCQARRHESREFFHFREQEFVILLIGNDWKNKGLEVLLRALAKLKHLPVYGLIVGSDDAYPYRNLIEQFGLQERIRFEKPSPDVMRFYASADLYAGPSLEDAFNLPIVEAMACGLPVIASIHAGASENIQDGENGFLLHDPGDPSELARLLSRLVGDLTLRTYVGAAAGRSIKQYCDWDSNVQKTLESLETTLRDRTTCA